MFDCHKKHGEFEFFAEKRLIFGGPETPSEAPDDDLTAMLNQLRSDIDSDINQDKKGYGGRPKRPPEKRPPTPTHTTRADTRALPPEQERNHKDTTELVLDKVRLNGKLPSEEVNRMQAVNQNLHEQYMNPAFMHHLQQKGLSDKVYPALDRVISHPDHFRYSTLPDGTLQITKKTPETAENKDVDDQFLIELKTKHGSIARVRTSADPEDDIDLETKGKIDWMNNVEYNTQMANYRERFLNEYKQGMNREEYKKLKKKRRKYKAEGKDTTALEQRMMYLWVEPYEDIDESMQKIYELENIQLPNRLLDIIGARGLPFEQTDPRIDRLRDRMTKQGKDYEEITKKRYRPDYKLQVMVIKHPEVEDAYLIYMKPKDKNEDWDAESNKISISAEGYLLMQDADGNWIVDPRYDDYIRRQYYVENPEAKVDLNKDEITELEKQEGRIKKRLDAIKEAKEKEEENERIKKRNREKVENTLKDADLDTLKKAAKAVTRNENHKYINKETDKGAMLEKFKKMLDNPEISEDTVQRIAKALDIELEAYKE